MNTKEKWVKVRDTMITEIENMKKERRIIDENDSWYEDMCDIYITLYSQKLWDMKKEQNGRDGK